MPRTSAFVAACVTALLAPAAASAAAPANDNRADAIPLPTFPATARGTTSEATVERLDPQVSDCGLVEGTVWYRIDSAPDGHVVVTVEADSVLAPVVRVYQRGASSIREIDCGSARAGGRVVTSFQTNRGGGYLILVGRRRNAPDGEFDVRVDLHLPPANDRRTEATPLGRVPATIVGTTLGATGDESDAGGCGLVGGTVWYSLRAPADRRIVLRVAAEDDVDVAVAVVRRIRSQYRRLACAASDDEGTTVLAFDASRGVDYLVAVGLREGSDPGNFSLAATLAERPETRPGRKLPRAGLRGAVHGLTDVNDVWWVGLRPGATYRLAFRSSGCATAALRLRGRAVRRFRCNGYTSFTPGPRAGGRYTIEVAASPKAARQPYRIRFARASADDVGVGIAIRNRAAVRGSLAPAGIDVVDLYHFDVARASDARLSLVNSAGRSFDLLLMRDSGARLGGGERALERRLRPGRYVVAVRGEVGSRAGMYRLSLLLRTLTTTRVSVNGLRTADVAPGTPVRLAGVVSPAEGGVVELTIERFDPLTGWHFHRRYRLRGGLASLAWTPPALGRWRVRARFLGTGVASPSSSGYAILVVSARRP